MFGTLCQLPVAVLWFRSLITVLSPHRPKLNPTLVHAGFVVDKVATRKFKTHGSAGKVKLTIFWDVNGPILVHFQGKGQTVTSARYSDMLVNELKPAI
jgi:hypothetical protein